MVNMVKKVEIDDKSSKTKNTGMTHLKIYSIESILQCLFILVQNLNYARKVDSISTGNYF